MRRRGALYAPAIVVAARQTAGRGRGTNTWFSAAGSLTVTFVLPIDQTMAPHHVPLAAGLAVRNAAAELTAREEVGLKWPNDVYFDGRKLAGVLCERLDGVDLIGIGMNVNRPAGKVPAALRDRIVFLEDIAGVKQSLTIVAATIARHIHLLLVRRSETPFPLLLREYDRHHVLVGRRVNVLSAHESPVSGKCEGLDDSGRLLVRRGGSRGGLHRIVAGHIELR